MRKKMIRIRLSLGRFKRHIGVRAEGRYTSV